jgi:acyl-CoA thioesterase FadM
VAEALGEEGVMRRFTERLATRGYELDAETLIPPHTYLRYMEHVRWQGYVARASAFADLAPGARAMVIAAERVEVHRYLGLGVDLVGEFWLARVGRTSMDLANVLRLASDGSVVARCRVTAVYVGDDRRPRPVPEGVRQHALGDDGEEFDLLPGLAEAPPESAWRYPVVARPSDTDLMQHVTHSMYLAYFEDARRFAAGERAYGDASAAASRRLSHASLDYREQALAGDRLVVRTWAISAATPSFGFVLQRERDERVLCSARVGVMPEAALLVAPAVGRR